MQINFSILYFIFISALLSFGLIDSDRWTHLKKVGSIHTISEDDDFLKAVYSLQCINLQIVVI